MSEKLKKSYTVGGIDVDHDYRVKIPFIHGNITNTGITKWNETCAIAIHLFGLPGDKYTCRLTHSNVEFWFRDEKDAMLFELTCG
jgi:hypothetical protein